MVVFLRVWAIQILVVVEIGGAVRLWVLMLFSGVLIVFGVLWICVIWWVWWVLPEFANLLWGWYNIGSSCFCGDEVRFWCAVDLVWF